MTFPLAIILILLSQRTTKEQFNLLFCLLKQSPKNLKVNHWLSEWLIVMKHPCAVSQVKSQISPILMPSINSYLEHRTTIYKWMFQLDDSKSLYIENGCFTKHPLKAGCLGFQVHLRSCANQIYPSNLTPAVDPVEHDHDTTCTRNWRF